MMQLRLPSTMAASMVLHVGALLGYVRMEQLAPKPMRDVKISGVDIITHVHTQLPHQAPVVKPRQAISKLDIFKMALPAIPKVAAPLDLKPIEAPKPKLMDLAEKLEDKGRLKTAAKIEALDLGRKLAPMAQLDASRLEASAHHAIPTDAPKLEEVGMRRASKKVIEMAALQERETQLKPQGLDALEMAQRAPQHRIADTAPLQEATPEPKRTLSDKMRDLLPTTEPAPLQPALTPREEPRLRPKIDVFKPVLRQRHEAQITEKKKAMEIEGPLASRRLVSYDLPTFPDWLAAQGVQEAEVRIKFYVNPAGDVLPDLRIDTASGYGRLDRLCLDKLINWKFEPIGGTGRQWGIITFRFVLE